MDELKKEETKVEEERIDIPEKFLNVIKEKQSENLKLMNEFVSLSEHYFALLNQTQQNVRKRTEGHNSYNKFMQTVFNKLRLDPKEKWSYDMAKGQFVRVIRPETKPAVYKENENRENKNNSI